MSDQPSAIRKFLASRWYVLAGGILAFFLLFNYARAYYQSYSIQKEISRLQSEKERLDAKYLKTVELFKYVQTPEYVESKARVELNMVKPGEHAAIIQSAITSSARQTPRPVVTLKSNPQLWWEYFFGKH